MVNVQLLMMRALGQRLALPHNASDGAASLTIDNSQFTIDH
jgi:hypothetical protein